MKKAERLEAEKYLLQRIFEEDPDFVDHTMEAFSVSRSTVYNYLTTLQNNGEVERVGGAMPYRILYKTSRFTVDTTRESSEDRVFSRDIAPLLADLPANVQKIWRYAFTAMLNNAFERCAGIVFGKFSSSGNPDEIMTVLKDFTSKVKVPVYYGLEYGHELPFVSLRSDQIITVHQ